MAPQSNNFLVSLPALGQIRIQGTRRHDVMDVGVDETNLAFVLRSPLSYLLGHYASAPSIKSLPSFMQLLSQTDIRLVRSPQESSALTLWAPRLAEHPRGHQSASEDSRW